MFSNVKGHSKIREYLEGMIEGRSLPPTLLFHGQSGVGKRTLAIEVAKRLNCIVDASAGCVCPSCTKIDSLTHLDVFYHEPEGETFKIDQVRGIILESDRYRMEGEWRIFILDGAENLGSQAADALLKTLEEGRPNTLFILLSDSKHNMISTLSSRCLDFYFGELSRDDCRDVLNALSVYPTDVHLALGVGSVERTKYFMGEGITLRDDVLGLLSKYPYVKDYQVLKFVDDHPNTQEVSLALFRLIADIIMLGTSDQTTLVLNHDSMHTLEEMRIRVGDEKWKQAFRQVTNLRPYFSSNKSNVALVHHTKSTFLALKDILR